MEASRSIGSPSLPEEVQIKSDNASSDSPTNVHDPPLPSPTFAGHFPSYLPCLSSSPGSPPRKRQRISDDQGTESPSHEGPRTVTTALPDDEGDIELLYSAPQIANPALTPQPMSSNAGVSHLRNPTPDHTLPESSSSGSAPRLNSPSSASSKTPLSQYSCPICFSPPTSAALTPCGHILCSSCLYGALRSARERALTGGAADESPSVAKCPVCRAIIKGWDWKGGGVILLELKYGFSSPS